MNTRAQVRMMNGCILITALFIVVPAMAACDKGTGNDQCQAEICGDGIDNDCDGLIDDLDPDCQGPGVELCYDGLDNDWDGAVDCWDSDCGYEGAVELSCADGRDNDCDGGADGMDPDCPDVTECSGCRPDQVCVEGVCTDVPASCPCPQETYCDLLTGTCVIGCIEDGQCSSGRICLTDVRQCRDGCRSDETCGAGRICEGLQCIPGCRNDGQCPTGEICEGLSCRAGCRSDAQCGAGLICEALSCRAGCRVHESCDVGQVCDPATLLCRAGCRGDGECPTGQFCNTSALTCQPGCNGDERCPAGQICEGGSCRAGCRSITDCGEEVPMPWDTPTTICSDGFECVPFAGSGRCYRDDQCADGQACNIDVYRCETFTSMGICYDHCHHRGCSYGDACVNGQCIERDLGARCATGVYCGLERECSSVDWRCYNLRCDDGCGPVSHCTYGSTCQSYNTSGEWEYGLCFDGAGCTGPSDCTDGTTCVVDYCTMRTPCTDSSQCAGVEYICSAGTCTPFFDTPCTSDEQCDRAGFHCERGIGRCSR